MNNMKFVVTLTAPTDFATGKIEVEEQVISHIHSAKTVVVRDAYAQDPVLTVKFSFYTHNLSADCIMHISVYQLLRFALDELAYSLDTYMGRFGDCQPRALPVLTKTLKAQTTAYLKPRNRYKMVFDLSEAAPGSIPDAIRKHSQLLTMGSYVTSPAVAKPAMVMLELPSLMKKFSQVVQEAPTPTQQGAWEFDTLARVIRPDATPVLCATWRMHKASRQYEPCAILMRTADRILVSIRKAQDLIARYSTDATGTLHCHTHVLYVGQWDALNAIMNQVILVMWLLTHISTRVQPHELQFIALFSGGISND